MTEFRGMLAGDVVQIGLRASQIAEIEAFGSSSLLDKGRHLAELGEAWTVINRGRVVAIGGFLEQHEHEAVAWIAVGRDICPAASLSLARFARLAVTASKYDRIEALIEADNEQAVKLAKFIGLQPRLVMHKKGANRSTQILFERVV